MLAMIAADPGVGTVVEPTTDGGVYTISIVMMLLVLAVGLAFVAWAGRSD